MWRTKKQGISTSRIYIYIHTYIPSNPVTNALNIFKLLKKYSVHTHPSIAPTNHFRHFDFSCSLTSFFHTLSSWVAALPLLLLISYIFHALHCQWKRLSGDKLLFCVHFRLGGFSCQWCNESKKIRKDVGRFLNTYILIYFRWSSEQIKALYFKNND